MNNSLVYNYVKEEWQELWSKKYYDEIRSESVSTRKYTWLEVEKGQVIKSSRSSNLDFYEILEENYGLSTEQVNPDPRVGGWRKFAKDNLKYKKQKKEEPKIRVDLTQQKRKHGEGWKNLMREWKKIRESEK